MKLKFHKSIFASFIFLILVACSSNSFYSSMTDSQCSLPCWISITPGETNASEAIIILSNSNHIKHESVKRARVDNYDFPDQIFFDFRDMGGGNLSIESNIVNRIHLGQMKVLVKTMFEKYGEPEQILVIPYWQNKWYVTYVYLNKGLIYQTINGSADHQTVLIDRNDEVSEVYITNPSALDETIKYVSYLSTVDDTWDFKKIVQKWSGFRNLNIITP